MLKVVGARLWYLPPYSPDLNPIEKAFSKIKHWMRLAQKRTPEGLSRYVGKLLQSIRQTECCNYIQSAGYAHVKT
jgi:transposase